MTSPYEKNVHAIETHDQKIGLEPNVLEPIGWDYLEQPKIAYLLQWTVWRPPFRYKHFENH